MSAMQYNVLLTHCIFLYIIFVTRLSILLNWLHERDPVRYDVYCTQIKVACKAGMIDQITVSLDKVQLHVLCKQLIYFVLIFPLYLALFANRTITYHPQQHFQG